MSTKYEFDVGYYEISKKSNINFFQINHNGINSLEQGSYLKIEDIIFLQTTFFRNITPTTMKIRIVAPSQDLKEDLQTIYDLARYNPHHVSTFSSKLPLPLHIASKAINDIKKYLLDLENIKFPWFY